MITNEKCQQCKSKGWHYMYFKDKGNTSSCYIEHMVHCTNPVCNRGYVDTELIDNYYNQIFNWGKRMEDWV